MCGVVGTLCAGPWGKARSKEKSGTSPRLMEIAFQKEQGRTLLRVQGRPGGFACGLRLERPD